MKRVFRELQRRKVLRSIGAYLIIAWLIAQIVDIIAPALGLPDWVMRFTVLSLAAGLPLVAIVSWFFNISGGRILPDEGGEPQYTHGRTIDFIIIAMLVAALGVSLFFRGPLTTDDPAVDPRPVVAVMPLDELGDDANRDGFVAGLHDDLLTTLSRVSSLRVLSRTSVLGLARTSMTLPEIGLRLGANVILEGSVQRSAQRIRVNVQLIDVTDDTHLWANIYDEPLTTASIFEIQRDVARHIANQMRAVLSPEDASRIDAEPTQNFPAYRAYLLGKQRAQRRTSESLDQAVEFLQQAVTLDPAFAAAYAELAMAYSLQTTYSDRTVPQALSIAMPLAQRAVQLDPNLPEAHTALADLRSLAGDRLGAEDGYRRAIDINPNYPTARQWLGIHLRGGGRYDEALAELRTARALDPLSVRLSHSVASTLVFLGRNDEAIAEYRQSLEIDPTFVASYAHIASLHRSVLARPDIAAQLLLKAAELDPGHTEYPSQLAATYLELNDVASARIWVDKALALGPDKYWPNRAAMLLAAREGDAAAAVKYAKVVNELSPGQQLIAAMLLTAHWVENDDLDQALILIREFSPPLRADPPIVDESNWAEAGYVAYVLQEQGKHEAAAAMLHAALAHMRDIPRTGGYVGLDIADVEAYALLGERELALEKLREAVDGNWRWLWWMLESSHLLESLRDDPRFVAIVEELKTEAAALSAQVPDIDRLLLPAQ